MSAFIITPEKELYYVHIGCVSPVQTIEDTKATKENNNCPVKGGSGHVEVEYKEYSKTYIKEDHEQAENGAYLFHHPVFIHTESFS
jgi:hypothetical protein